jgi:hypothetical protein
MTLRERSKGIRLLMTGVFGLVLALTGCSGGGFDGNANNGVPPFTVTLNSATPCTGTNGRQVLKIDFTLTGVTDQQFQLLLQYFFDGNGNGALDADENPVVMTPATQQQLMDAGIDDTGYFDPATDMMFDPGSNTQSGVFFWCVNSDLPFGGNVCLLLDAANVEADQMVVEALMCGVDAPAGLPTTSTSGDANAAPGPMAGGGFAGLFGHTAVNVFDGMGDEIVIAGGTTTSTMLPVTAMGVDSIEDLAFDVANLMHTTASGPFTMATSRQNHASSFFYDANGGQQVLVVGGSDGMGADTNSSEIFSAGMVSAGPSMSQARSGHTATWLPNNTVLVAGGMGAATSAEIYDPSTNSFSNVGFPMPNGRTQHTACLLPDGRVMLAGGFDPMSGNPINADFFDVIAFQNGQNPWTTDTATGPIDRQGHTATLLVNGVCYLVGGRSVTNPSNILGTAHAYRTFPMTILGGAMFPAGFSPSEDMMITNRANHATNRLGTGDLLITGGFVPSAGVGVGTAGGSSEMPTMSTEAFLPVCFTESSPGVFSPIGTTLGDFTPTADLSTARARHTGTTVNSGAAVVIGGQDAAGIALDSVEFFPFTNNAPTLANLAIDSATATAAAVPVSFDLSDAEGDKAFCVVQYSTDGGMSFSFATLTDFADTVNLFPGTNTVTWNAAADGVSLGQSVVIRIIPVGGVIGTAADISGTL